MSSTTTNLGLVKMASGETIGQWSDANNGSGGNLDKIDTAVGNLNSQKANFGTALKDTRLPSTNQQIENVLIGQSRNIMYLGNGDTIDDVIIQTKTGDLPLGSLHGLSEANVSNAATDLDSCDYAGAYMFNNTTSNHPSGANYGVCFTIATSQPQNSGLGWVCQIAFGTSDATKLYMRTRINNLAWSAWKSITFS